MKAPFARIAYTIAILAIAGYAAANLTGSKGIGKLLGKEREISALEKRNSELSRDNERRRQRIERLTDDPAEQERVIKERLKYVGPGEKVYILGDSGK